ncbi:hypothetical protein ACFSJY_06100 [Thalassotalea euphylliae]|uniref:hypothetical protein n=1 Tax=Thalassotalea euphylliae TaxID=1655234 RepID=UPI00363E171C
MRRRLNDAHVKFPAAWSLPVVIFLFGALFLLLEMSVFGWLQVSAATITGLSYRLPSKENNHILGYMGPVDLSRYNKQVNTRSFRVEPSLDGSSAMAVSDEQLYQRTEQYSRINTPSTSEETSGASIDLSVVFNNKKTLLMALASLIVLASFAIFLTGSDESNVEAQELEASEQVLQNSQLMTREYPLPMPDNFTLYLNQYDGLSIYWQGDQTPEQQIWSQTTGDGDKSCSQITFNNGKKVRTLDVTVENGSDYFAYFSPIDTKSLLQLVAFRGSFELCGYEFSLKGSQSALGKHNAYAKFVDY